MCGRYYIDDDTAREIEKLVRQIDVKMMQKKQVGDVHPSEPAAVITHNGQELVAEEKRWGFPGFQGKSVIFNARAETAMEKPMFRESVAQRRCIIPGARFYEWNRAKEKIAFERTDSGILYMAGIYKRCEGEDRFVILTTKADALMQQVHDRMPLLLEQEELETWLCEDGMIQKLLQREGPKLKKIAEYEQESFFFME